MEKKGGGIAKADDESFRCSPSLRLCKVFLDRNASTSIGSVLVCFIDDSLIAVFDVWHLLAQKCTLFQCIFDAS